MRHLAPWFGFALLLGCGDNPPNEGGDEVAEAEATQGTSESADSDVDESAESTTTQGTTDEAETEASTGDGDADADTTESTGDGDAETDTAESDTTDTTTGEDPEPVAQCVDTCVDASECASPQPPFDEDNWTCFEGGCQWLGCKDDECAVDQVCHDPGTGVPACLPACMAAADCDQGVEPFVASNYSCDAGACVFLGCAGDSECEDIGFDYVCAPDLEPSICVPSCESPQDCASPMPAFNVDNWTCDAGACIWLGCKPGECGKTKTCQVPPPP